MSHGFRALACLVRSFFLPSIVDFGDNVCAHSELARLDEINIPDIKLTIRTCRVDGRRAQRKVMNGEAMREAMLTVTSSLVVIDNGFSRFCWLGHL